jgi:hypothetical protein
MVGRIGASLRRTGRPVLLAMLLAVTALPPGESLAMWSRLSDAELFERSDLIVTGVLIGRTRIRTGQTDLTVGVIRVQETLKGPAANVALLVLPETRPTASDAIPYDVGASGLWYLRLRGPAEAGLFVADHPQRFVPAAEAQPAIAALRKRRG